VALVPWMELAMAAAFYAIAGKAKRSRALVGREITKL